MEDTVVSTPAVTTETVSTPEVSTSTPSERPTSMREAFEMTAAEPESTDSAQPGAATTAQAETTTEPGAPSPSSDKKGPIPFDVHEKTLDNARRKEREAVSAEWKPYEWAKQVPRESLEQMSNVVQRMNTDPIGFLEHFEQELRDHPTYGPQLASRAGRTLAGRRGQQTDPEPQADVEILDGNGQVTGATYSAKQLAERDAWRERALMAKVAAEYGPLKTERDERQRAEQKAKESETALNAKVDSMAADILDLLDGNEALTAEVLKTMHAHPDWSPRKAALHVRDTSIVTPKLQPQAETKALDTFKTKAAAQGIDGSTRTTVTPSRPRNATELAAFMRQQAGLR